MKFKIIRDDDRKATKDYTINFVPYTKSSIGLEVSFKGYEVKIGSKRYEVVVDIQFLEDIRKMAIKRLDIQLPGDPKMTEEERLVKKQAYSTGDQVFWEILGKRSKKKEM